MPIDKKFTLIVIIGVLGLIGFLDTSYLAVEHYRGGIVPCTISNGCETVLTSSYSVIAGIPIALVGSMYYAAILILITLYIDTKRQVLIKLLGLIAVSGFIVSAYLVYLQAFVIKAYCTYCLLSAGLSVFLLIFSIMVNKTNNTHVQ
ncbi:MAG: vitamin K epoxide reductase family protein [Candidatus Yanofskybacteria bacterium]|nr:vitamin K epoxide reductase family protein [Candidatus Yanofskybacteria bacterium]